MIVLANPRSARWKHRLPLSVLALAAVLEERIPYAIVDGNFVTNFEDALTGAISESRARYLAVTVMPGPQLMEAIPACRTLKQRFPGLTIIWGGYFASLHSKVVLESGFVDFVVRGQGEWSFLELIQALENGHSYRDIPGLCYRDGARTICNPKRQVTDPNSLPPIPYHRLDVRRYVGKTVLGSRTLSYHSSFGCPYLCGFCAVAGIYEGRWIGKNANGVADEVLWLRDAYGVNAIEFVDNNFFVSEKRTRGIAARLESAGLSWWGEARPDTVMNFSDETLRLMRRSGCMMIFFGAESSSDAVLERMDKGGSQTAATVLELAARFAQFDIVPEFSFVLGTPADDVDAQIARDIRFIRRIKEINPRSEIVIYVYSPVSFDDAALLQEARQRGFEFPQRLLDWLKPEWASFDLRKSPTTPWLNTRHIEQIRNFERVLNARYPTMSDIRLKAWQTRVLKTLGAWRYRLGVYGAPYEIRFVANRWFKYRQPEIEGF
jgi:radical SAM superfamily enzyme YgiQ (UPF0313 family)